MAETGRENYLSENLREQSIREQFHPSSNFQLLFVLKVTAYSLEKFLQKKDSLILVDKTLYSLNLVLS